MFSTFKILVIYLIIIPSRCGIIPPPAPSSETTTLSLKEQIEEEMYLLKDDFKNIMDSIQSVDLKVKLGVIQGKVEKIIERAVKAEKENKMLLYEKGQLENKLEFFSKPLGILSVRSRLETLVDDLYPERRPFHVGVATAFEEILTSKLPKFADRSCIKIFRNRVISYGISAEDFMDAVRSLYGSFSDKAAHKMSAFEPLPPPYDDKDGIRKLLMNFGITPNDAKVCAIQIILQPLPMSQ